jgi:hypothetical protein
MWREKGGKTYVRLLHGKRHFIQFIDEFMRIGYIYLRHVDGGGPSP